MSLLLASVLWAVHPARAQDSRPVPAKPPNVPVTPSRPPRVVDTPNWLEQQQADDGRWSAEAKDPRRDVRMTALCLLAALADGNTLRLGRLRNRVRSATTWLREQQGTDGSFGPAAAEGALEDQALATLALLHCAGLSEQQALRPAAQQAFDSLLPRVRPEQRQYSAVVAAWTALAVDAARSHGFRVDARAVEDLWPRGRLPAFGDGQELEAAAHLVVRTALLEAAAEHDARVLALAAWLAASPRTTEDPLAAWFTSWALYGRLALTPEGTRLWRDWQRRLRTCCLPAAQQAPGSEPHAAPPGEWTLASTRTGATAFAALTSTVWYRYCRLVR